MNVKTLIEKLSKYNPEAEVVTCSPDGSEPVLDIDRAEYELAPTGTGYIVFIIDGPQKRRSLCD